MRLLGVVWCFRCMVCFIVWCGVCWLALYLPFRFDVWITGWVVHCGVGFTRLVSFASLWVLVLPICGLRLAFRLFGLVGVI